MIEGHHGSCICGKCLTVAYTAVVINATNAAVDDFKCTLCLEGPDDREAMDRPSEHGWQSPMYPEASVCRRCIKQAAGALHKDKDTPWYKPTTEA